MQQDLDLVEFTNMLLNIGLIYGKELAESQLDLYWQALKCYAWQDVKRALVKHLNDPDLGQYFPKPADVVRLIDGSGKAASQGAWIKVYTAMQQLGAYRSVRFDDPVIHAVIADLGGWIKLCATKVVDVPFTAKDFQRRYLLSLNKARGQDAAYCAGILETANAAHIDCSHNNIVEILK